MWSEDCSYKSLSIFYLYVKYSIAKPAYIINLEAWPLKAKQNERK